jgi:hypothetical protein
MCNTNLQGGTVAGYIVIPNCTGAQRLSLYTVVLYIYIPNLTAALYRLHILTIQVTTGAACYTVVCNTNFHGGTVAGLY